MAHIIPQPPSNDPLTNGIAIGIAVIGLAILIRQTMRNGLTSRWWHPIVVWMIPGIFAGLMWATASSVGRPYIDWSPLALFVAWTWGVMLAIQRTTILKYAQRYSWLSSALSFCCGLTILGYLLSWGPVMQAREAARRTSHNCSLKIIGLAMHNYHDMHRAFPMPAVGEPPHSWRVAVLPFVDAVDLYRQYDFAASWDSDENEPIARTPQRTCHRREGDTWHDQLGRYYAYFAMITGPGTIWEDGKPKTLKDITDGTSNTILAGEAVGWKIVWTEPRDVDVRQATWDINRPGPTPDVSDSLLSSTHECGAYAVFADGAVRFLSQKIDPKVLKALVSAKGNDKVGDF